MVNVWKQAPFAKKTFKLKTNMQLIAEYWIYWVTIFKGDTVTILTNSMNSTEWS